MGRTHPRDKLTKYQWRVVKEAGRAIHQYQMISGGDRVLIGLSGGKDSTSLLKILAERRAWLPVDYTIVGIHVFGIGPCADKVDIEGLAGYCDELGVEFHRRTLDVGPPEEGKSRCWWCTWNRRKVFFEACREFDCNRLALAHHQDDINETLLLNLFWHGEISTMSPRVEMFKGTLSLIRPLAYLTEGRMKRFARESEFPLELFTCPQGQMGRRGMVKQMIHEISRECPKVRTNLFRAMARAKERIKEDHLV